jgi:MscS family membrane protein
MSKQKTTISPLFLLLGLFCLSSAAEESDSPVAEAPAIPADEFNRGTPKRSAHGLLAAVDDGDYETAAEYLDLDNLQGEASDLTGVQLSRQFSAAIRRADWVDVDELIDDPAGRSDDDLPDYRDSIGVVLIDGQEARLFMQKVLRSDGVAIWKVSNATVSLIPRFYANYSYPEFVEYLAVKMPAGAFLGYEYFKWLILLAAGLTAYALVYLIALAVRRGLGDPEAPSHRRVIRFIMIPFGIWALILTLNAVATWLGSGVTIDAWRKVSPLPILITVWMLFGLINLFRDIYANRMIGLGRPGAAGLLRPAANALKGLIVVFATLIYFDKLGFDITTVLAGLGVGGLAVALALQKPMEDVFGAFTLYTQQPIRLGDFCRIGSESGTIEEIGLRTTRVRTLANTLIAIPNAKLANEPIENISAREKIRYKSTLRLKYGTTPEQIRRVLGGIRDLLESHERILQEGHRVRFNEIADDALLVEALAYLDTTDFAEYLELAEGLNIRILEIVTAAGTSLSLPARTLYVEQGAGAGKVLPG